VATRPEEELLTPTPLPTVASHNRYVEIDLLRTLAILMMIVYHSAYDLEYIFNIPVFHVLHGGGWLLGRSTAVLFLLLVGVSFAISYERSTASAPRRVMKYLKRGMAIVLCGMLVTASTYLFDPETFVRFGILHMIGVSVMLLPLVRRLREGNALLGLGIILLGNVITHLPTPTQTSISRSLLLPFGFLPPHFASVDYYPLLPWFGVILLGIAIADAWYIRPQREPQVISKVLRILSIPGKHALAIYLLHQPIMLFLLLLILR